MLLCYLFLVLVSSGCATVVKPTAPTFTSSPVPPTSQPTISPSPTETRTPTITPTSTITSTPSATFTPTSTQTLVPLTALAKQAIQVALAHGFASDIDSCAQEMSCQAYISQEPYMLVVIRNDGLITVTIWDETHSLLNYAKPWNVSQPGEQV